MLVGLCGWGLQEPTSFREGPGGGVAGCRTDRLGPKVSALGQNADGKG